jgi:hypothetical protein
MDMAKQQAERTRERWSSAKIQIINKNIEKESMMAKLKREERKVPVYRFARNWLEK